MLKSRWVVCWICRGGAEAGALLTLCHRRFCGKVANEPQTADRLSLSLAPGKLQTTFFPGRNRMAPDPTAISNRTSNSRPPPVPPRSCWPCYLKRRSCDARKPRCTRCVRLAGRELCAYRSTDALKGNANDAEISVYLTEREFLDAVAERGKVSAPVARAAKQVSRYPLTYQATLNSRHLFLQSLSDHASFAGRTRSAATAPRMGGKCGRIRKASPPFILIFPGFTAAPGAKNEELNAIIQIHEMPRNQGHLNPPVLPSAPQNPN